MAGIPGMKKDQHSGAHILVPTPEQIELMSLHQKVEAIYHALSEPMKKKVDKELEVRNG